MSLAAASARFLDHLKVERRLSPHTIEGYRRDLDALAAFLGTRGIETPGRVVGEDLRAFIAAGHRQGLSPKSLARRLSACRSLFRFLVRREGLDANPCQGLRAPRAEKRLPKVLDADEAGRAMQVADTPLAVRDRAMLELLYSSGLRLAELVGLNWDDIDLKDGLVRVLGKGAKVRVVPVGRHAREALLTLAEAEPGAAAEPVFRSRHGQRISHRAVQARLAVLGKRQGLSRPLHPHLLRHSCASHLLESSGDLRAVQELLGHADIATTQIYTHILSQRLHDIVESHHPLARRPRQAS